MYGLSSFINLVLEPKTMADKSLTNGKLQPIHVGRMKVEPECWWRRTSGGGDG